MTKYAQDEQLQGILQQNPYLNTQFLDLKSQIDAAQSELEQFVKAIKAQATEDDVLGDDRSAKLHYVSNVVLKDEAKLKELQRLLKEQQEMISNSESVHKKYQTLRNDKLMSTFLTAFHSQLESFVQKCRAAFKELGIPDGDLEFQREVIAMIQDKLES